MLPFVAVTCTAATLVCTAINIRWQRLEVYPDLGSLILIMAVVGILAQFAMLLNGKALEVSPRRSAVTWTIFQMSMVVPFLSATILWYQKVFWYQYFGIIIVALALVLLAPADRSAPVQAKKQIRLWASYLVSAFFSGRAQQFLGSGAQLSGMAG